MKERPALPVDKPLQLVLERVNLLKLVVIAMSAMAIFNADAYLITVYALTSDLYNYILLIPFLIAYFLYTKRHSLVTMMSSEEGRGRRSINLLVGSSLLLLSFVVYQYGSGTLNALDFHIVSFQLFLAGVITVLFDTGLTRRLAFPILLMCTSYPYLGQFALGFWTQIASSSTVLSGSALSALGYPVSVNATSSQPPYITTNGHAFQVGLASSGLYSLVGFCLFLAFLAYYTKGPAPNRLFVLVLAFPLLYVINVLRLVIVVAATVQWGDIGYQIFHFSGGIVLVFVATLILLVVSERFLHLKVFSSSRATPDCDQCSAARIRLYDACPNCGKVLRVRRGNVNGKLFLPLLVVLVVSLIFVSSVVPAVAYATSPVPSDPRFMSSLQAQNLLPVPELNSSGWTLTTAFRSNTTQTFLNVGVHDELAVFTYLLQDKATASFDPLNVIIEISGGPPHLWETSVIAATVRAPLTSGKGLPTIFADSDTLIPTKQPTAGRYFVYLWPQGPAGNNTVAVLYWIFQAPFQVGSATQLTNVEITLYSQYLPTYANDGLILSPTDYSGLEVMLTGIAAQIASAWSPHSGLSSLQSDVNAQAFPLLGLVSLPLIISVGIFVNSDQREKVRAARAYRDLPKEEKDLVKSVAVVSLGGRPTTSKIADFWAKFKDTKLSREQVNSFLVKAEGEGLIGRSVAEENGMPVEFWHNKVPF
jgi:exosortase/archaeosortase family protein